MAFVSRFITAACGAIFSAAAVAQVPIDLSKVRPGPVSVTASETAITARWKDEAGQEWSMEFSLKPDTPLITAIVAGRDTIIKGAQPYYEITAGKRRGGWDNFFDWPLTNPAGVTLAREDDRNFQITSARAETIGDRVELSFNGFKIGNFSGSIRYLIFPQSRLIEQAAVLSTNDPDVAYSYDTGVTFQVDQTDGARQWRASYYDTEGTIRDIISLGGGRQTVMARYRTIASPATRGSLAVFPAPHRYFPARDGTSNEGYLTHAGWAGTMSLGIRQHLGVMINAPPLTQQRMSVFLLPHLGKTHDALADVLRYTNRDRFPALTGYVTFAPHWHFAFTSEAMAQGYDIVPPFKPVLRAMNLNVLGLMDFHGDGHAYDLNEIRLQELKAYHDASRKQSTDDFLMLPMVEANVHYGGHWSLAFPKPVYWFMDRQPGQPFVERDPKYGTVYRVGNTTEMQELIRRENGFAYQAHPRTKGSTGYPDSERNTPGFRDPHYFGASWKSLPSDLCSPRLGERGLTLLDDMANWGLKKRILGEVDVHNIDATHELYAHMNVNYVKLPALPKFDDYGKVLEAVRRGDFFISTGEVLLPEVKIAPIGSGRLRVTARIRNTFPLQMAEVVWGDGSKTKRKIIPLSETRAFGDIPFTTEVDVGEWKWARFAVWDIAANGAFVNPTWKDE